MKCPSLVQSSGQPAAVPILTSVSSGPAPFADLTYKSKGQRRFDAQTIRDPSGDHIGGSSMLGPNVSRDRTPRTESSTQMSPFSANAIRVLSGARRKFWYVPGGPNGP